LVPTLNCEKASQWPAPATTKLFGDYVDDLAAALVSEVNRARSKCEKSVVFAATNVCTGVKVGAALTNQDFSGVYLLA
jgi:hypothetical protein